MRYATCSLAVKSNGSTAQEARAARKDRRKPPGIIPRPVRLGGFPGGFLKALCLKHFSPPAFYEKYLFRLSTISFSISAASPLLPALTEIYALIFGSVPDGRTTTEQ